MLFRLLWAALLVLVTGTALAGVELIDRDAARSLLLEATENNAGNAVPITGTVSWSRVVEEGGVPALAGEADIPDGNLHVHVTIRRNDDQSLPASHIIEVSFEPSAGFRGGSIADLPAVLLKSDETQRGEPLAGASVRYADNGFLLALSGFPQDVPGNASLLASHKWLDIAVTYATGQRAIISMEKDALAMRLFTDVLVEWAR
jgi:hypothetical protein